MNRLEKKWELPDADWCRQSLLTKALSISPVTARVLLNRGICTPEEARLFLKGSLEDLACPWNLPGMTAAVQRITDGIKGRDRILVYGDYDVDGITATAVLVSFLREIGVSAGYYIPDRSDGYGLNEEALEAIADQGYNLVITVDCGISAAAEITYGRTLGLDFVVTDHHEPGEQLPDCPVVNPKVAPNLSRAGELAGVGVAFKLVQALASQLGLTSGKQFDYLDLVALGTIADVVPLVKDNRLLVKYGLIRLRNSRRPGIQALCETASINQEQVTAGQIAFLLAPRLNAAGRMDSPFTALDLLLTDSVQKARELAFRLQELNSTRQLLVQQVQIEAEAMAEGSPPVDEEPVLVLASPFWHPGVIGIVAAKLAEKFFRPVILLTIEGELAKGSGRSIAGFDLFQAVVSCEDLLLTAGGHCQAVGLTLAADRIDSFRRRINSVGVAIWKEGLLQPSLQLDAEVLPEQLDLALVDELSQLEPFGHGNPEPVLMLSNASLKNWRRVGKDGNHLKLQVQGDFAEFDCIGFNLASLLEEGIDLNRPLDLAFRLERNRWNGQVAVQLVLEDLREHRCPAVSPALEQLSTPSSMPEADEEETPGHFCVNGSEQLQLILELVLAAKSQNQPVCLLFPSQRMLAVYEKLLSDSLIKYNVTCQRLHRRTPRIGSEPSGGQVFLAVEGINSPLGESRIVRLAYPQWDDEARQTGSSGEILLGFRELDPEDYEFIRKPLPARDKLGYIEALIRQEKGPVFIYTNRKKQVLEIYRGLQLLFPHKKGNILYYHQGLCFSQKEMILAAAAYGSAEVIIANEFVELLLPDHSGIENRVIVDAPYSCDELFLKSRPRG
ncbi:MAG: single-stranded-DNA-specific exonuclease RecJ, partial [Clostridia bacterium]|nr:single-stranded-DNA-specific exonuclease RecJ [Clostridia bacterium]